MEYQFGSLENLGSVVREDGSGSSSGIRQRTFDYALRSVKLYQFLLQTKDGAGIIMGRQFMRSATSVGANVEEAFHAESRADFIHKNSIAQKEAGESHYWLRLLVASEIVPDDRLQPLLQEGDEIVAILTSIIVKSKRKN